jgi:hypothetical protein
MYHTGNNSITNVTYINTRLEPCFLYKQIFVYMYIHNYNEDSGTSVLKFCKWKERVCKMNVKFYSKIIPKYLKYANG